MEWWDMKPMIILGPEVMTPEEIKKLTENGICVVVAKEPERVRFVDPIPAASSRTEIENAAIKLSRKLISGEWGTEGGRMDTAARGTVASMFVALLARGTPLDRNGTAEEQRQRIYDSEKEEEIRRIAREDARKEAAEKRAAKAQAKKG